MKIFLFLLWILFPLNVFCQTQNEIKKIKSQLSEIFHRDQSNRKKDLPADSMIYNDSINLVQVEELIAKYGWLGKSKVGEHGNITLWVVIQHADLPVQEKYLPLLEQSVKEGESRPQDLALLTDRILMRQGKKQLYGSQIVFNKETGASELYPIENESEVNVRRKAVGLEPLEDYLKYFGIEPPASIK